MRVFTFGLSLSALFFTANNLSAAESSTTSSAFSATLQQAMPELSPTGLHLAQSPNQFVYETSSGNSGSGSGNSSGLVSGGTRFSNLNGFSITIVPGATLIANPPALNAFNTAAQDWVNHIADPISVTINADLVNLNAPNIIGQAGSVLLQGTYNEIRNQLAIDAATGGPSNVVATAVPTAAQFNAVLPTGFTLDGNMLATKANLKAMGFLGLDVDFGANDGTIQFNTQFNFDYDRSNGITAGSMDFQTVATHEIGHILGYNSGVDDVDFFLSNNQTAAVSPYPMDLFRFQNLAGFNPANLAQFTTFSRYMKVGGTAIFDDLVNERLFATGTTLAQGGDGSQASHWKDDQLTGNFIGIMDPTLAFGIIEPITPADLRLLDLIGYTTVVPEPSTWMLLGCSAATGWFWKRRKIM